MMDSPEPITVEFDRTPVVTHGRTTLLELHSVLNISAALFAQLDLLEIDLGLPDALLGAREACISIRTACHQLTGSGAALLPELVKVQERIKKDVATLIADPARSSGVRPALEHRGRVINSILSVLASRISELRERYDTGRQWIELDCGEIASQLRRVLQVIALNSSGDYRVVFDPDDCNYKAYLVLIDVRAQRRDGTPRTSMLIPAWLTDTLRDLTANARKYSAPGTCIRVSLVECEDEVELVVADQGVGIPAAEIERVIEYGYRASNVRGSKTFGEGVGLTKAYRLCQKLDGRMWIASALGAGTTVTLRIPIPQAQ